MSLEGLHRLIVSRPGELAGMPLELPIRQWIPLRDAAQKWCNENNRDFLSDALVERSNFIWGGVPVIAAG